MIEWLMECLFRFSFEDSRVAFADSKLKALVAKAVRWPTTTLPVPLQHLPGHIAIIMDGNGRWATRQGMIRVTGHQAGVTAVREITRYCGQLKVKALTLFAFSTENWKRPQAEIRFLFRLLKKYLANERPELIANNVRLTSIGNIASLPADVRLELRHTEELTAANSGLNLCLALNYGAQDEILSAAQSILQQVRQGSLLPQQISTELFESSLFTGGMPPLDLLIRTAGERRLSNFLLWQACTAEFYVSPVCWPDFRREHLEAAIIEYAKRPTCGIPI